MDQIETAITQLVEIIETSSPNLKPYIFPTYLSITSLISLCQNEGEQKKELKEWLKENHFELNELVMETSIDYTNRKIRIQKIKVSEKEEGRKEGGFCF